MHIHILGICGTFMTGIATLAQSLGHEVTGSDTNFYPPMSNHLENMKIEVTKHYGSSQLKNKPDQVIVGNVMTRGHEVIESLLDSNIPFTSGPQCLYENILRKKFGVPKKFGFIEGRVTYIIDSNKMIIHIFEDMLNGPAHIKEAIRALKQVQKTKMK